MKKNKLKSEEFSGEYARLKDRIINEIWDVVRKQPQQKLNIMETKDCPAIVTKVISDEEQETIDELVEHGADVLAIATYGGEDFEYNLEEFEVPLLIAIMGSVEKHLE
jgi:hypothetical protein